MAIIKPVILEDGQLKTAGVGDQVPQAFVQGLDASLSGKAATNDPRLTDAREWTATTISQAEAEAGTVSTRRAFTAQRVRQAINAWWQVVTSGFGRNFIAAANEQAARNVLQLGTAATANLTTSNTDRVVGKVLRVGDFGVGGHTTLPTGTDLNTFDINGSFEVNEAVNKPSGTTGWGYLRVSRHSNPNGHCYQEWTELNNSSGRTYYRVQHTGTWLPWREIHHTGNILQTTGTSSDFPMSQKATTDQLATKTNTSTQVIAGTGLTGGGNLSANRTLNVSYGTAAGTAAQGNDSRLSDSREWTAATISQAEAEAGTATTRRAFTAQRVRQATVAWFTGISGALGRTILTRTTTAQVRSDIGLRAAAIRDVGLAHNELIDNEVLPSAVGTANLPRTPPTLNFNFMKVKHLDPSIQFTRGSTATYTDATGNIRTAEIDEPRFTYDPATGEAKGLLVEEQRTNLLTWSEDSANAAWGKLNATIISNAEIAPDGTMTADKLVSSATTGHHYVNQSTPLLANQKYTGSIFVKAAEYTLARLQIAGTSSLWSERFSIVIDLTSGTVHTEAPEGSLVVEPHENGWWRIAWTNTFGVSNATAGLLIGPTDSTGTLDTSGDGESGIYIWGAQLEQGSTLSSYIPTEGAQVTRTADRVSREMGEEFNPNEGTLFIRKRGAKSGGWVILDSSGGGGFSVTNTEVRFGGVNKVSLSDAADSRIAITYKDGVGVAAENGVIRGTATALPTYNINRISVGSSLTGSYPSDIACEYFGYFPRALSEAELQEITK